jgi:hypothetical protein
MIAILVATGLVTGLAVAVARCADQGKPTRARQHWNAPPPSERRAPLADLLVQTQVRAEQVLPGARLTRLRAREVDAEGQVALDHGSATFEYVAAGAEPCSVTFVVSWQGTARRPGGACHDDAAPPRCEVEEVVREAFAGRPAGARALLDYERRAWTVYFRDLPGARPLERADDCGGAAEDASPGP